MYNTRSNVNWHLFAHESWIIGREGVHVVLYYIHVCTYITRIERAEDNMRSICRGYSATDKSRQELHQGPGLALRLTTCLYRFSN